MKLKVLLVGPLLTRSGYGEQARFALRALRSRSDLFEVYVRPLAWGQTSWISSYDEEKAWIDETIEKTIAYTSQGGQFDTSIQVTIPNEWQSYAPINIGYTAGIETTQVSHVWLQAANQMDRIVVVSNHSKDVFEKTSYSGADEATGQEINLKLTTRCVAVNYPVKVYETSSDLELDLKFKTNFLAVAQWGPRKNVINMIKWFVEEFKEDEVGFVIKTNQSKNSLMDREFCEGNLKAILEQYPDRKCKVYLLHGDMTDAEMHALYKQDNISAFVAIPHGEGFGLPIFEAVYSGLPVVATGWSGQMDFLCDENGKEHFYNVAYDIHKVQPEVVWENIILETSGWAYARETSYKQKLRECYTDLQSGPESVEAAQKYAEQVTARFDEQKMYDEFIDAIDAEDAAAWNQSLSEIEIL
tara:strand:- start:362 stop:1603 length:1242 start_codon:yes stop_codon:yes gene_type:complete